MRTKRIGWLVAALAWALLAALAPTGPALAKPTADHLERHAERLGLDEETRRAIAELAEASRARQAELWGEVREERARLRALLAEGRAEREAILAQAARVDELRARAHRERLETTLRIHELLSPAQRDELVRIREERRPERRLGCRGDLSRLCPDAAPGPDSLRCLAERFEELSRSCRRAVERLADDEPRWRRPKPDR